MKVKDSARHAVGCCAEKKPRVTVSVSLSHISGALAAAFATVSAAAGPSAGDRVPSAGLVFEQIGRVLPGTSLPAPDSFATDAARIANLPPLPNPSGVLSALEAAKALGSNPFTMLAAQPAAIVAAAASAHYETAVTEVGKAYLDAGVQTRVWRYGQWTRVDYPRLGSASITKPEQGLEVSVNLSARNYRETRTPPQGSVETYTVSAAEEVQFQYNSAPVTRELGTATIAGILARGYQTEAAFTTSRAVGRCAAGAHVVKELEYVATNIADPDAVASAASEPNSLAREACLPSSAASHREPGRLVLFRATAISAARPTGDITYVVERGNLRPLTDADASQFSVPDTFTRVPSP